MASQASSPQRFYVLEEAMGARCETQYDKPEPYSRGDAPRCPRCGAALGMLKWLPPYRVELELYGEELGDYAPGSGSELLISERFAEAFRAEGLTGLLGFHPAEVLRVRLMKGRRGRKSVPAPRYFVVWPCFSRATVDVVLNRVRISTPITCGECLSTGIEATHGFILEPGTWGGEDVFRPRGMAGKIVVSERFKELVERHGLTNMVLTPTEQFIKDPSNLGPAPLPTA